MPTITVGGAFGALADASRGFQFASTVDDPGLVEKQRLPGDQINGIDPANVDARRRARGERGVRERGREFQSSLGAFQIGTDGLLDQCRNSSSPTSAAPRTSPTARPPRPRHRSSTSATVAAGTQLGFFLVADGFQLNDQSQFQGGQFELRNGGDLTKVASLDDGTPPVLVYVKGDELITVQGVTYLTVNADPLDPHLNVLNPDGQTHVASWYDSATGDLVFGFEDKTLVGNGDGDFNDAVFRLHFGAVTDQQLFYGGAVADGSFNIDIADDGSQLKGAELQLTDFKAGDQLELTHTLDANGDGLVDGTAIRIVEASATRFVLSGTGTIDQYEQALNSLKSATKLTLRRDCATRR